MEISQTVNDSNIDDLIWIYQWEYYDGGGGAWVRDCDPFAQATVSH